MFASLLRREEDDKYYLVTPVEKCEISVDLHPLMVVDTTLINDGSNAEKLGLVLNVGGIMPLDASTGLAPERQAAGAAYIHYPEV